MLASVRVIGCGNSKSHVLVLCACEYLCCLVWAQRLRLGCLVLVVKVTTVAEVGIPNSTCVAPFQPAQDRALAALRSLQDSRATILGIHFTVSVAGSITRVLALPTLLLASDSADGRALDTQLCYGNLRLCRAAIAPSNSCPVMPQAKVQGRQLRAASGAPSPRSDLALHTLASEI